VRDLRPVIDGQTRANFQVRTLSPGDLKEEHIRSRELGYYSLWMNRRLALDIKLFRDDLDNLISQNLTLGYFEPNNAANLKQQGFETEADFSISEQLRLRLGYALINSSSAESNEKDLTPHKSGSAALIYNFAPDWQISTFYYYAYPINENKFSRLDTRLAKKMRILASSVTVSGVVQHYFYKYADLFRDNQYDSPNRVYLSIDLTF
jgi:iron complex outermembrane receptor protein